MGAIIHRFSMMSLALLSLISSRLDSGTLDQKTYVLGGHNPLKTTITLTSNLNFSTFSLNQLKSFNIRVRSNSPDNLYLKFSSTNGGKFVHATQSNSFVYYQVARSSDNRVVVVNASYGPDSITIDDNDWRETFDVMITNIPSDVWAGSYTDTLYLGVDDVS